MAGCMSSPMHHEIWKLYATVTQTLNAPWVERGSLLPAKASQYTVEESSGRAYPLPLRQTW